MKSKKVMIFIILIVIIAIAAVCLVLFLQKGAKKEKIKVACIGDSITYGYGIEPREGRDYPAVLAGLLGEEYEVKNYGLTGRTVQLSGDLPYSLEDYYTESRDYNPDIVLFMLGTNDTKKINWDKENFINDYKFLLEGYRHLPSEPKVYIMLPPPVFLQSESDGAPNGEVLEKELLPAVKQVAKEDGIEIIDLFTLFKDKPDLLSDGCHPTAEGAALIAKTVYEKINSD